MSAVDSAAQRLGQAARTHTPCAPVRDLIGTTDITTAYRVQQQNIDLLVAKGDTRVGRKIGLTSLAVQRQLNVDQPDFGTLLASMHVSPDQAVAADKLLQPRIEAEVAFVLGADIRSSEPTMDEVTAAVGFAYPALEITDSRIFGWDITITDTIADNASSGQFVLGPTPCKPEELDLATTTMSLTENGIEVSSGTGAACLGSPLIALRWLAATAARMGDPLQAGEIILSGALGPMVSVHRGATYEAVLVGLGVVRAQFLPLERNRS